MKARVRRWSGLVFRPVAIAFDPRLEGLEHRIVERLLARLDGLERHVAGDADTTAEMAITQSRLLARLDARLAALEASGAGAAVPLSSSHAVAVAWALGAIGSLGGPGRIALSAPGDPGLALALVGLGHEVVLLDGAPPADHPRLRRDQGGGGALDAAIVLCGEGADGPLPVAATLAAGVAGRLRAGGELLLSTPQRSGDDLEAVLGGLRLVERRVMAPAPGGAWEVVGDGSAGDGIALLRAVAER